MKKHVMTYADGSPVDYPRVKSAAHTFENDLSLVGHPALLPRSPFERPYHKGKYTFTDILWRGHRAIEGKMTGHEYALLVACMDKDFARKAWEHVNKQVGRQVNVASIFLAGGAAQENHCRLHDLAATVEYYAGFRPLHSIWLAGHLENCGGLGAFSCGGDQVCAHHGFAPNSVQELTYVRRIMEAAQPVLIPADFAGNVQSFALRNRRSPEIVTFN